MFGTVSAVGKARQRGEDETWFSRIWEEDHARILRYVARRVAASEIDDAVAAVFQTLWRRRRDVDHDAPATGWLFAVARLETMSRSRAQRRRNILFIKAASRFEEGTYTEPNIPDTEVADVLATVGQKDREVLELAYWDDLSVSEIATTLGCSVEAAQKRLERARERFSRAWESHLSENKDNRTYKKEEDA